MKLLEAIKGWYQELKQSPINYFTLTFKEDGVERQFRQTHRETIRRNARIQVGYYLFMLALTPVYMSIQKEAGYLMLAQYAATVAVLLLLDLACCYSLVSTEFMMFFNFLARGAATYAVGPSVAEVPCISAFFKVVTYYLNMVMGLSDLILLRSNQFALVINVLLYFGLSAITGRQREEIYEIKGTPLCSVS